MKIAAVGCGLVVGCAAGVVGTLLGVYRLIDRNIGVPGERPRPWTP